MSDFILIDDTCNRWQVVGELKQEIVNLLKINLKPGVIFLYPGAIKHIKKRHLDDFYKYFQKIPEIIADPDYVGVHPNEKDSMEFVKNFEDDVLVAIKLDIKKGYLYLSTMFSLPKSKVPKRIRTGRLLKVPKEGS